MANSPPPPPPPPKKKKKKKKKTWVLIFGLEIPGNWMI